MADTGIFATTAEVQRKVTAYAHATPNAEAYINDFMTQAESYINCVTGYNWSDAYTTLNADVKGILKECASSIAAMYVINYNTSGFPSLRMAELALDVLNYRVGKCIEQLKEKLNRDFMVRA